MTGSARRSVPLLLAGVAAALVLTACAKSAPVVPLARTPPQPALAGARWAIPNAARQVTLSLDYGRNADGRRPPAPVTISDPARVGGLVRLVTRLPPRPPGTYNCPPGDGIALQLAFRAHPGGLPLATADLELNGCGGTDLTVRGRHYELGHPGSARRFAAKVLTIANVRWKLPPFYWPGT